MGTNRARLTMIIIGTVAVLSGACSNQSTADQETAAELEVNVYSARHYDTDDALYKQFTEQTGIKVNLFEGKNDELLERIKSEGSQPKADVLITVDAGRLWRAEQEQLLQPMTSEILTEQIPANLRHPEGLWFGLTQRAPDFGLQQSQGATVRAINLCGAR